MLDFDLHVFSCPENLYHFLWNGLPLDSAGDTSEWPGDVVVSITNGTWILLVYLMLQ